MHNQLILTSLILFTSQLESSSLAIAAKLRSAVSVSDNKAADDDSMFIKYDGVSGHSGWKMRRGVERDSIESGDKPLDESNRHLSTFDVDGFKLGQRQQQRQRRPDQLAHPLNANKQSSSSIAIDDSQQSSPYPLRLFNIHSLDDYDDDLKNDFQVISNNNKAISTGSTLSTIIQIPSTANKISSKIYAPSTSNYFLSSTTSSPLEVNSLLIEDYVDQTNRLLIDLEEQIKLSQFDDQTESNYKPIDIYTSTKSSSSAASSLPLAYGFKLTAHNFLFRPLITTSSVVSSAVNLNSNPERDGNDDGGLSSIDFINDDHSEMMINNHNHHWYSNQKQSEPQIQPMVDEVTGIEQNVESLIGELVTNRRYVTAAVFRSLLNYLRRSRMSLERLQSRMAFIGVTNPKQGSSSSSPLTSSGSSTTSLGSAISSSVSSIASSVSSTLTGTVSGPLGGSSGGPVGSPISSGSAIASTYLEAIRGRLDRISDSIRKLITRFRSPFSSSSSLSSASLSSSSSVSSSSPLSTTTTSVPPSSINKPISSQLAN